AITRSGKEVPEVIQDVLRKMLSERAGDHFATMSQVVLALSRSGGGEIPAPATPVLAAEPVLEPEAPPSISTLPVPEAAPIKPATSALHMDLPRGVAVEEPFSPPPMAESSGYQAAPMPASIPTSSITAEPAPFSVGAPVAEAEEEEVRRLVPPRKRKY